MATLSVAATHVSLTDVVVGVVAAKPVGTLGTVVSTIQVFVAGDGSGIPFTVAKTENVWEPWARPLYALGLVHEPGVSAVQLAGEGSPALRGEREARRRARTRARGRARDRRVRSRARGPAASATPPESEVATQTIAIAASTVSQRLGAGAPGAVRPIRCMSVPPTATQHGYGRLRGSTSPSWKATARAGVVSTLPPVHTGTGVGPGSC